MLKPKCTTYFFLLVSTISVPKLSATELFEKVAADVVGYSDNGTVDEQFLLTQNNLFDLNAHISQDIFKESANIIALASHEVLFQTYWFEGDSQAVEKLVDGFYRLEARRKLAQAESPVPVYIVIDSNPLEVIDSGMFNAAKEFMEDLSTKIDPSYVEFHVEDHYHWLLGSNHSKSLIVDGQAAVITGANSQNYLNEPTAWYDLGFTLFGEAAALPLRQDFLDIWQKSGGDPITTVNEEFISEFPMDELSPRSLVQAPALFLSRTARDSYNNDIDNPQDQGFISLFKNSQNLIKILSPNLNDDAAIDGLAEAAARGVELRIILSKKFNETTQSMAGQGGGNDEGYQRLVTAIEELGGSLDKVHLRWFSIDGIEPVIDTGEGIRPYSSHAKYSSFDGLIAVVGSANMDTQSWNHSREINVAVDSAQVTQSWDEKVFDSVFARSVGYQDFPD